jgi:hypothetical protein
VQLNRCGGRGVPLQSCRPNCGWSEDNERVREGGQLSDRRGLDDHHDDRVRRAGTICVISRIGGRDV